MRSAGDRRRNAVLGVAVLAIAGSTAPVAVAASPDPPLGDLARPLAAVLAPATPFEAPGGGRLTPMLRVARRGFASEGTLVRTRAAAASPALWVRTANLSVRITPLGFRRSRATLAHGGAAAVYRGVRGAVDAVVRPVPRGVALLLTRRARRAPRAFTWRVGLLPGQTLQRLDRFTVALVGPATPAGLNARAASPPRAPRRPLRAGDVVAAADQVPSALPAIARAADVLRTAEQARVGAAQVLGAQKRVAGRVLLVLSATRDVTAGRPTGGTLTVSGDRVRLALPRRHRRPVTALAVVGVAPSRIPLGAAIDSRHFSDPDYLPAAAAFDSVTPENDMKMWLPGGGGLEPAADRQLRFDRADAQVDWAVANGLRVRGHALVYGDNVPTWMTTLGTDPALLGLGRPTNVHARDGAIRDALHRYVTAVVAHFKGRIRDWDVVNEPFADDGSLKIGCDPIDKIHYNFWGCHLGPNYVADVLGWAHDADPAARLFVNETGPERPDALKTLGMLTWLTRWHANGVPLTGVGLQMHTAQSDPTVLTSPAIAEALSRIATIGYDVEVTEMDVEVAPEHGGTAHQDVAAQRTIFDNAATACAAVTRCTGFTVWGLGDRYSWRNTTTAGGGQVADALPLLLDTDFNAKPVFYDVAAALAGAAPPAPPAPAALP